MRRLLGACAALLLTAACAGETTGSACVLKIDVKDPTGNLTLNNNTTVMAAVSAKSGNCSTSQLKSDVTWETSNTNVLTLLIATDSTVSIKGIKAGSAVVRAYLTMQPSIRDSTTITVAAPVDQ